MARLAGDYGFGYDPLFIPDECGVGKAEKRPVPRDRSYAQLTPDEKDAISHRGWWRWQSWKKNYLNLTEIKGETIMLTSKQRAILRGKANTMDPVFHRGQG